MRFSNPHSWIYITVKTDSGEIQDWAFEGARTQRAAAARFQSRLAACRERRSEFAASKRAIERIVPPARR